METGRRYRINLSTSTKGVKTYDCTLEINYEPKDGEIYSPTDMLQATLEGHDAMVTELDCRYPPQLN